jgi:hypothetical protein
VPPPPQSGRTPRTARAGSRPVIAHEPSVTSPPRISAAALKLHVFAVLVSIYQEHPGLVTRAYLAGISDDTDLAILDLCSAGLWTYTEDGYVVPDQEVRRIARVVHELVDTERDEL